MKTFEGFYASGDYANALLELEKSKDQLSPGVWHFNMGTVKAKLGQPAEARYHFLESRWSGFTDERLANNLALVEDTLEVTKLEKPLEAADYLIKFGLWAQNGFFTMLSLLVLFVGFLILRKQKKYSALILTALIAAIPVGLNWWVKSWPKAVILSAHQVQDGPSVIFGSRGELPPGIMVVTKKSGEWAEIIFPSRFRGWIKNTGLKELE